MIFNCRDKEEGSMTENPLLTVVKRNGINKSIIVPAAQGRLVTKCFLKNKRTFSSVSWSRNDTPIGFGQKLERARIDFGPSDGIG